MPGPRTAVLAGVVAAVGLGLWVIGAHRGAAPTAPPSPASGVSSARGRPTPARGPVAALRTVTVRDLGPILPKALVGTAAAPSGGRIYLLGGAGPAGFNATVYAFTPPSAHGAARVAAVGRLPQALHDAGAAAVGNGVLLCGGGRSVGVRTIYHFSGSGLATLAGRLPHPLSDLGGVVVSGRPYCLGGWTGSAYSDAVFSLAGLSGAAPVPPIVARLPHAVRYAAALAARGGVLVAGGRRAGRGPTADVQWVPLAPAGGAAVVGHLPQPLAYVTGAPLQGWGLVVGGCTAGGTPVAGIEAVDRAGAVRTVGALPAALCYASAASAGGAVYVFGGETAGQLASNHVWEITPGGSAAGSAGAP